MQHNLIFATITAACLLSACASWEPEVVFPENFRDSYTKVLSCRKSVHQAANYQETWLSPGGVATWTALAVQLAAADTQTTLLFPEGTVIVKAQFDDSKCDELANYTTMKKLLPDSDPEVGDWKWQYVGDDGECNNCAARTGCSGCHSTCKPAPWMCSKPDE